MPITTLRTRRSTSLCAHGTLGWFLVVHGSSVVYTVAPTSESVDSFRSSAKNSACPGSGFAAMRTCKDLAVLDDDNADPRMNAVVFAPALGGLVECHLHIGDIIVNCHGVRNVLVVRAGRLTCINRDLTVPLARSA